MSAEIYKEIRDIATVLGALLDAVQEAKEKIAQIDAAVVELQDARKMAEIGQPRVIGPAIAGLGHLPEGERGSADHRSFAKYGSHSALEDEK